MRWAQRAPHAMDATAVFAAFCTAASRLSERCVNDMMRSLNYPGRIEANFYWLWECRNTTH